MQNFSSLKIKNSCNSSLKRDAIAERKCRSGDIDKKLFQRWILDFVRPVDFYGQLDLLTEFDL